MGEELVIENRRKGHKPHRAARCLIVLLVVLLLIAILFLVAAFATRGFGLWEDTGCHTKQCVQAASRILHHMDPSADPCDDFYKYACGNYGKAHVIPPGKNWVSTFDDLSEKQAVKLHKILETEQKVEPEYVKQPKNFYKSCMNETEIDKLGINPLREYIRELGGWTVLNRNYDLRNFRFEDYWIKLGFDSYGGNIFSVGVSVDPDDSQKYILYTSQASMGMGRGTRDNYLKGRADPLVKAYEKTMNEIAGALGAEPNYAKAEIAKIVEFELEVAKLTLPPSEMRDSANNSRVVNLADMRQYAGIDWNRIMSKALEKVGEQVQNNERIYMYHEPFITKIGSLIERTPAKTLAGYLMWRNIWRTISLLDKPTREFRNEFNKERTGVASEKPRYRKCIDHAKRGFMMVIARMFADEFFNEGASGMEDLTKRVKEAFKNRLHEAEWLDAESTGKALEKVDAMVAKLAYPKFIKDDAALMKFVNEMNYRVMDLKSYFDNAMNIRRMKRLWRMRKVRKPVNRDEWHITPVTVNAYYSPSQNSIVFPLGILNPPFYENSGHQALNFGAIGEVIGHEVTHGFDDSGRLYDKYGNKHEWMTKTSVNNFKQKAQCVIDAYSNITIKQIGVKVNGVLTQGENIADLGGLPQAFEAYQSWVADNGYEKVLPGIDLTPDQLFFVSYAQMSCSLERDKSLRINAKSDPHTPNRERILGAVRNTKEFSQVFHCPVGSEMNPSHKCAVW